MLLQANLPGAEGALDDGDRLGVPEHAVPHEAPKRLCRAPRKAARCTSSPAAPGERGSEEKLLRAHRQMAGEELRGSRVHRARRQHAWGTLACKSLRRIARPRQPSRGPLGKCAAQPHESKPNKEMKGRLVMHCKCVVQSPL